MTGPDPIAATILTAFAYLILNHHRQTKHRSTTRQHQHRRTENGHGQDHQPTQGNHHTGENHRR